MTLETFLEKFDQFADAPTGVAKMRELVRHLAVTGNLVDQDHNDEPALALLYRIAAHKTALAKEGKLRGPTTVAPMPPDEGTRVLPSSWTWVRFGEIMLNRDGERIPVSKEERAIKAKTYDYYGASGVIDKIDGYLFDKPLLLVGEDGANLINRSTPIAFMARGQYWVNNHAHVLDGISEDFLRYIELYINAINLESYVTGSAQPKMNQAKMNRIPIALPPLAEQKRIVAKVDEVMALCDRLEAQQQERETRHAALARASLARFAEAPTPANLNFLFYPSYSLTPAEIRSAILRQVFLGKMRWEPRSIKASRSHLSRLQVEHREAWKSAQLAAFQEKQVSPKNDAWMKRYEAPELPKAADLPRIPEHWAWISLELACPTIIDSPHRTPVYAEAGEYPALRPRDVAGGVLKLKQAARVEKSEYERQTERRKPRCGDIVYSRELSFGWAVILPDKPRICLSQGMVSMQAASEVDTSFLCKLLNSPIVRDQAEAAAIGAAHPHVNLKDIRVFAIPFPPLAEQRRIVAKVDQLMALVDELETKLAASRATAAHLLSALVAELTKQDFPETPLEFAA